MSENYNFKSDFLQIMQERGFLYQISHNEELDKKFLNEAVTAYIGFDATAESLHIGSLLPIMILYWLQKTGHNPIILMGGGTTLIGDPSGKDKSRQLISTEQIEKNKLSIKNIFKQYLKFDDHNIKNNAISLDNKDWLCNLNYLSFLREYGTQFTINKMLNFESVKLRLEREEPLTFLEFNYMILQAYDFLHLNKNYNCTLQMGGSDQWGNIINGVELIRRNKRNQAFALTTNLLTTADGKKMGKSEKGAVWLNKNMISDFDFWQYWRNIHDNDVGRFLRLFTTLDISEIQKLEKLQGVEINEAKKILANHVTTLNRGENAAKLALQASIKTFEHKGIDDNLNKFYISKQQVNDKINLFKLLVNSQLCKSGNEARNFIKSNACKINNIVINQEFYTISEQDFQQNKLKLSLGKKKHILVILQ